ncbi:HD-GYP domain-containing protein [Maridesulfovibrio salexigens]|uniref:Metal dependent phosphohydrolase n=1 Tax=Maridesulfovibrio salexigens (strain ATCC 14822 / DSM 2638 / NCIMB 8403 / VKM B-1763) TaxID=526222 RepID=C6C018_MARSD|nr:HD domain-containing phosphohydrolase [Maridesulfovibrio salexigens]ACS80889.1 metal dependent phosphohydrolase [Maridesulfovibrio salexigens DSM 2638]
MEKVAKTINRHPEIIILLVIGIITTIAYPLRSYYFVLPYFSEKLLNYSEEEAEKTANYWAMEATRISSSGDLEVDKDIDELMKHAMLKFGLEKVKIFNAAGEIVYSTAPEDIGKLNRHEYFKLIVAKGKNFSKIVTKNQHTLEGRFVSKDLAEIYIPIMDNGKFAGAFELYYDLTLRKEELDNLLINEAVFGSAISFSLLIIIVVVLIRAGRLSYYRDQADEKVRSLNKNLEKLVYEKTQELQVTQEVSIQSLAILAENYDPDTGEHLNRIRNLTYIIASKLREGGPYRPYLTQKDNYVDELALASILHDIGKTSVPVEILSKQGKLTDEEFKIVREHTTVAGTVLNLGNEIFINEFGKDSYLALAADVALYHHEKWDGTGYPLGLCGEEIPLSARIVAIADVYDALRSKRPYKAPWSHEKAMELIKSESGKHFDPVVVDAFLEVEQIFKDDSSKFCPMKF